DCTLHILADQRKVMKPTKLKWLTHNQPLLFHVLSAQTAGSPLTGVGTSLTRSSFLSATTIDTLLANHDFGQ
ncbi:MAG: hypothetical protein VB996_07795, partial [Pseudomonadales bacterium]